MSLSEITYDVVIPTYNGAHFILEQLQSICDQKDLPVKIIISDDGSIDSTLSIIHTFSMNCAVPIVVLDGPGKGVVNNVFFALQHTTSDYVLISDQDDIWLPNKSALFKNEMIYSDSPHLIFSDSTVWYSNDNAGKSFWLHEGINPYNSLDYRVQVFRNSVQGASSAVNRALVKMLEYNSNILMHDWWFTLMANTFGKISIIHESTLLYRQHASNQVGAKGKFKWNLIRNIKNSQLIFKQIAAFYKVYGTRLSNEHLSFYRDFNISFENGLFARVSFLLKYKPFRKNIFRSGTLWASILFVKIN